MKLKEFKAYCQRPKVKGWSSFIVNLLAIPFGFYVTWYLIMTFPGILTETEKLFEIYGRSPWIMAMPFLYWLSIAYFFLYTIFTGVAGIVGFLFKEVKQ